MKRWAARLVAFALTGCGLPGPGAHAQSPGAGSTGGEAAAVSGDIDEAESPELRTLRLAERELMATPEALVSPRHDEPRQPEWLGQAVLPDLPVRWDDRVVRFLDFFRSDPRGRTLMTAWLRRAGRYSAAMRAAMRAQGLPEDLEYVAMVESGYDPTARSRTGAVGLWQFMPPTASAYGLARSHWIDERMSADRATDAAARYLRDLHQRLGSWELALAAYNMGYTALLRAIHKYNTNDFWALSRLEAGLPFETTIYVAKVMACALVGRNPGRFGFGDVVADAPASVETVQVPGGASFALVARAAGVEQSAIAALNPEVLHDRAPPGEATWSIRIPRERATAFARAWPRMRARAADSRPYTVRFGETLAEVAYRFRTTERALATLNGLDAGESAVAGAALMVPACDPRPAAPPAERPVVTVSRERFAYSDRRRVFYRVREGDSASKISRFFSITAEEIRRWNGIDPQAVLQPGMTLQLFVPQSVDLARAVVLEPDDVRILVVGSDEFFDYHEAQRGRVRRRIRVEPGDTLEALAQRYDLSVGSLARINRIGRSARLAAGAELVVYAPREDPQREQATVEPPTDEAAPAPATVEPTDSEPSEAPAS